MQSYKTWSFKHPVTASIWLLFLLVAQFPSVHAQNGAADFDGLGGYLEAPGAGDLVAGSSGLTLAGWVYPRNAFPSFPNFDGFFGFRNDFSFDFYVLQLSATDVELRYKNEFGIDQDIVSSTLQLNQWQHLAMTYDGTYLRYYHNAVVVDSIFANGSIGSTGQAFRMGRITWSGGPANFDLDGQLDNVQVWSKALSSSEITELHCMEEIDAVTYPNLVLQYRLNDATGTTAATDAVGNIDANVNGGVGWVSSGVMVCESAILVSAMASVCDGDSAFLAESWQTSPGDYVDSLLASDGRDSIVTTTLSIWPLPAAPSITQLNDTTLASSIASGYQWYRNDTLLVGATLQQLINPLTGMYTVVITDINGCASPSAAFGYTAPMPPNGLSGVANTRFRLYPTLGDGMIILDYAGPPATLSIANIEGRLLTQSGLQAGRRNMDYSGYAPGWYIAQIQTASGNWQQRFYIIGDR